jgi:hypothetical protein
LGIALTKIFEQVEFPPQMRNSDGIAIEIHYTSFPHSINSHDRQAFGSRESGRSRFQTIRTFIAIEEQLWPFG